MGRLAQDAAGFACGRGNLGSGGAAGGEILFPAVRVPGAPDPRVFAENWRAFLSVTSGSDAQVAEDYGVTTRAARKWLRGGGGCRGEKVVRALALHPAVARRYLTGGG